MTPRLLGSAVFIGGSILLFVPAAPAQTSAGNAQIQMGGAITDYLDLEAQYGAAYDPASALYLEFIDPVAGDSSFVVSTSGPVTAGDYRLENCNESDCPFMLTIMPPPFGSNSFSTVGSSASGRGTCNLSFNVHSDGDVSGVFDCGWDEAGVTAEGYFETTLFEDDLGGGGGGDGGGGSETGDFNWPLWGGLGGAVILGGIFVGRLIFKRKPDAKDTDACKDLVAQYERLYEKWDEQHRRAEQGIARLEEAKNRLKLIEQDRMKLMGLQQEAGVLLAGAGLVSAFGFAALAIKICVSMAISGVAAMRAAQASAAALFASASNAARPAIQGLWNKMRAGFESRNEWWREAALSVKGAFWWIVSAGAGAGLAAKDALKALMERGMKDFNDAAARVADLHQSLEDSVVHAVREAKGTEQELLELAKRIERECGIVMRRPQGKSLFVTRPDGTPRF